jgi:gliding motility-associated-like protein
VKLLGSLFNLTKTIMKKHLLFLVLLLALSALTNKSSAAHYTGGEVYYQYIGGTTGVANEYRIFVRFNRNNGGAGFLSTPQAVCITSSCGPNINMILPKILATGANLSGGSGGWVVPDLDECADRNDPSFTDFSIHKYEGNVILPPCANYKIAVIAQCCRDNSTNLAASPNMYLEVDLNNTKGPNSSPQILAPAGNAFCLTQPGQQPFVFALGAQEVDGDSIVYSFAYPQQGTACGPGTNIPLALGYTVNNPIPSSTGIVVDQQLGTFTLSPSQQGSYVMKVEVKEYRFDTISLQWVYIGNTVRETQVPVTSACNPQVTEGPKLKIDSAITVLNNLLKTEMDSLKNAYGISILKGSDSLGNGSGMVTKLPYYHGYTCFDLLLDLNFASSVNYSSLKTTDFRLIGPDGIPRPIVGIKNLNQTSASSNVQLMLHQPLDLNGNYLLQIRRGNDANTLINSCGFAVEEFYSALVVVDSCPQPSYSLNSVSVNNNENIRLQWEVDNDFNNPSLLSTFNSWIIHRRDLNDNLMKPIKVIHDPSTRIFVDSALPAGSALQNTVYDYSLLLMYNGKRREMTRTCSTIKLNAAPSGASLNKIYLSWNHYNCLEPNSRVYKIYLGSVDSTTNSISWQQHGDMTSINNFMVNLGNLGPLVKGNYAYKVVVQNQKNNSPLDIAESNWVYFYHNPQMTFSGKNSAELQVPNIITPNGDGINDCFYLENPTDGESFKKISFSVYKRNGELLYENRNFEGINNSQNGWAGVNSSGQALASGVYYYVLEITRENSLRSEHFPGSITIGNTN